MGCKDSPKSGFDNEYDNEYDDDCELNKRAVGTAGIKTRSALSTRWIPVIVLPSSPTKG
jgi:hypothetical protein